MIRLFNTQYEIVFEKNIIINAWNEWTENMFLLPEKQYGTGYLKEIQKLLQKYER